MLQSTQQLEKPLKQSHSQVSACLTSCLKVRAPT